MARQTTHLHTSTKIHLHVNGADCAIVGTLGTKPTVVMTTNNTIIPYKHLNHDLNLNKEQQKATNRKGGNSGVVFNHRTLERITTRCLDIYHVCQANPKCPKQRRVCLTTPNNREMNRVSKLKKRMSGLRETAQLCSLRNSLFFVHILAKNRITGRMSQLSQSFSFDLANPLARNSKNISDLL